MEVFNEARFVRQRSCSRRGKYLAADVDGREVCLSGQRDGPYVLLRGVYGRYLLATDQKADAGPAYGVATVQADMLSCGAAPPRMLWQAIRRGLSAFVVVRSASGRFHRANGRYLRWRRAVTAADDNGSTMMQWDIESVPVRMTRPCILEPICQLKHLRRRPPVESEVARQVRFAHGDDDGNVADEEWKTMPIYTNNLMHLRLTLACCMGVSRDVARTTLCVRAGLYAQLSPLLIDLPIGNDQIDVVILNHGTPGVSMISADDELRYPELKFLEEDTNSKYMLLKT